MRERSITVLLPGRLQLQTSPLHKRCPKLLSGQLLSKALLDFALPEKVLLP